MARAHHNLEAWKLSMALARHVYAISKKFPKDERWNLTNQVRRSVISVPSNIAEGFGRSSGEDCVRFLKIARGSQTELETQLILANDFGYIANSEPILAELDRVFRLLSGLICTLARRQEL